MHSLTLPLNLGNSELKTRKLDKLRLGKTNYKERDLSKRKRKLLQAHQKHKGDKVQENEAVIYASGPF